MVHAPPDDGVGVTPALVAALRALAGAPLAASLPRALDALASEGVRGGAVHRLVGDGLVLVAGDAGGPLPAPAALAGGSPVVEPARVIAPLLEDGALVGALELAASAVLDPLLVEGVAAGVALALAAAPDPALAPHAAAVEAIADGLVLCAGPGAVANAAARELLGLRGAVVPPLERLDPRTIDGDPVPADELPDAAALRTGAAQSFRLRATRLDGVERVFAGTVAPIPPQEGTPSATVWLFRDVTREHNRELLTERFLEELFEALPIAVLVSDPETREVLTVNRTFYELLGFPSGEVIGARPPYPWQDAAEPAEPGTAAGATTRSEDRFRQRSGNVVPVEIVTLLIRAADGVPAAQVSLVSDLSERRRLERQLVQSGKLAALGELAAGVAHEINNPLFAILGMVEFLLLDAEEGTKRFERLQLIQQTGLEIKEIVRALLDFARERTDEHTLVLLDDVVRNTLELVRRTSLAKDVEIVERFGDGPFLVEGSANRLKQIFLNLITNAQQAMPGGGSITIELMREDGWVHAAVRDTGSGIEEEIQTRIFEPFFTTKREMGGTGLGLSVSLGIAHMHGGDLSVVSPAGEGATFTLVLPIVNPVEAVQ
ncbi:MAG: ATP-binding protein [Thermoleophilia bacterium]